MNEPLIKQMPQNITELTLRDGVRLLHRKYGMTMQQIGELLGVTVRTVENYEKGRTRPKSDEKYYDLCEIITIELSSRPPERKFGRWII